MTTQNGRHSSVDQALARQQSLHNAATDPTHTKRFDSAALEAMALDTNADKRERRLAVELLEAQLALARIRGMPEQYADSEDWKECAKRMDDIASVALAAKR